MNTLIIGTGVIGSIYGHVLDRAGHEVTHLVRPGRGDMARSEITIRLLDARSGEPVESEVVYRPKVTESLSPSDDYRLVLASVPHYELGGLLPVLATAPATADIVLFGGHWGGLEAIDAVLPQARYLWGYPVAGGGWQDGVLEAALLPDVRLGEMNGQHTPRLNRLIAAFDGCGLRVDAQADMLAWLQVHFAIEAAVIGCAVKAGDPGRFLDSEERLAEAVLAVRDTLAIVRARGIDVDSVPDSQLFGLPPEFAAAQIHALYQVDRAARRIFERHTGREELARIYFDVLASGRALRIDMPSFASLEPHVAEFGLVAS